MDQARDAQEHGNAASEPGFLHHDDGAVGLTLLPGVEDALQGATLAEHGSCECDGAVDHLVEAMGSVFALGLHGVEVLLCVVCDAGQGDEGQVQLGEGLL